MPGSQAGLARRLFHTLNLGLIKYLPLPSAAKSKAPKLEERPPLNFEHSAEAKPRLHADKRGCNCILLNVHQLLADVLTVYIFMVYLIFLKMDFMPSPIFLNGHTIAVPTFFTPVTTGLSSAKAGDDDTDKTAIKATNTLAFFIS
ncbi:MAG: hypothetical protein K2Z81_28345 [Cyanobacteria bacterium]|nr:hypothetical protein [Cyanobacteriota bacterium]